MSTKLKKSDNYHKSNNPPHNLKASDNNKTINNNNNINNLTNSSLSVNNMSVHKFQLSSAMFLSISYDDKRVYLWDEKSCSTINSFEDSSVKTSFNNIKVVNKNYFSDYFYATTENKSIVSLFSTSISEPIMKFSPLDEGIMCLDISNYINNNIMCFGSIKGNISIYDISSGNCLAQFNSSCYPILNIYYESIFNLIIAIDKEIIKIYTLNSILSSNYYIFNKA